MDMYEDLTQKLNDADGVEDVLRVIARALIDMADSQDALLDLAREGSIRVTQTA